MYEEEEFTADERADYEAFLEAMGDCCEECLVHLPPQVEADLPF